MFEPSSSYFNLFVVPTNVASKGVCLCERNLEAPNHKSMKSIPWSKYLKQVLPINVGVDFGLSKNDRKLISSLEQGRYVVPL